MKKKEGKKLSNTTKGSIARSRKKCRRRERAFSIDLELARVKLAPNKDLRTDFTLIKTTVTMQEPLHTKLRGGIKRTPLQVGGLRHTLRASWRKSRKMPLQISGRSKTRKLAKSVRDMTPETPAARR